MVIILVFTILIVFDGSLVCYDADLFTHMIWVYFVCLNFQRMKRKKKRGRKNNNIHNCFSTCFAAYLFSSPEYAQFWSFSGTCVNLTTSCCHSVGFCFALCIVLALNSWGLYIPSKCGPFAFFFWKPCEKYFQIIFREQNETERK